MLNAFRIYFKYHNQDDFKVLFSRRLAALKVSIFKANNQSPNKEGFESHFRNKQYQTTTLSTFFIPLSQLWGHVDRIALQRKLAKFPSSVLSSQHPSIPSSILPSATHFKANILLISTTIVIGTLSSCRLSHSRSLPGLDVPYSLHHANT